MIHTKVTSFWISLGILSTLGDDAMNMNLHSVSNHLNDKNSRRRQAVRHVSSESNMTLRSLASSFNRNFDMTQSPTSGPSILSTPQPSHSTLVTPVPTGIRDSRSWSTPYPDNAHTRQTTSPSIAPSSNYHVPNKTLHDHRILYISLPVACALILLLFCAGLDWTTVKNKIFPSRKNDILLEEAYILGTTQDEVRRARNRKTKAPSTASADDLLLLETLSTPSDESNASPIWIQMSQYGADTSILSPLDDVDSRFGDWYDDSSCNFTTYSTKSV
jgi:hypothetical protein